MSEFRVRCVVDVWLNIEANSEQEARQRAARIQHDVQLDIAELHAIGEIIEVEAAEEEEVQ